MSLQQIDRCGDCHSCCKSFGFLDENKIVIKSLDIHYEWGRCNKLADNNRCSIYDDRPKTCSKFKCLYIESDLPKKYLPKNIGFVTQLKRDKNGPFLTIVPHESKKTNVDPRDFWNNNYKNILVMKETAERMWSIDIPSIKIACARDEIAIKKAVN